MLQKMLLICCCLCLLQCKTPGTSGGEGEYQFTCSLEGSQEILGNLCKKNMDCSFALRPNSQIKTEFHNGVMSSFSIVPGDRTCLTMERQYQDNPAIADDEFSELLYFYLPKDKKKFHYENEQLAKAGLVYAVLAFTRDGGYYNISEGCLEGFKYADNHWEVQANLIITTRTGRKITKAIKAIFKYTAE